MSKSGLFILIALVTIPIAHADNTPKAATEACIDKTMGDVCSFQNDAGDDINGKCRSAEANGEGNMYCAPLE